MRASAFEDKGQIQGSGVQGRQGMTPNKSAILMDDRQAESASHHWIGFFPRQPGVGLQAVPSRSGAAVKDALGITADRLMQMPMKDADKMMGMFGQDGLDSSAVLHAHFMVSPINANRQQGMMHGDNHRLASGLIQGIGKPCDLTFLQ